MLYAPLEAGNLGPLLCPQIQGIAVRSASETNFLLSISDRMTHLPNPFTAGSSGAGAGKHAVPRDTTQDQHAPGEQKCSGFGYRGFCELLRQDLMPSRSRV